MGCSSHRCFHEPQSVRESPRPSEGRHQPLKTRLPCPAVPRLPGDTDALALQEGLHRRSRPAFLWAMWPHSRHTLPAFVLPAHRLVSLCSLAKLINSLFHT